MTDGDAVEDEGEGHPAANAVGIRRPELRVELAVADAPVDDACGRELRELDDLHVCIGPCVCTCLHMQSFESLTTCSRSQESSSQIPSQVQLRFQLAQVHKRDQVKVGNAGRAERDQVKVGNAGRAELESLRNSRACGIRELDSPPN